MNEKLYTTKTASLKATTADIRRLNGKEISLNGKNILDYISDSEFNSYDTRDPQLKNDELDIWNTEISLSEEAHIEVKPLEHTYEEMSDEQKELLLNSAAEVIDNEVLDADGNHLMYWQTDGLTEAYYIVDEDNDGEIDVELSVFCHYDMFLDSPSSSSITTFSSDLSSLTDGTNMFYECPQLTTFNADLSSLTDGYYMFCWCHSLNTFNADLSSLTGGDGMFDGCSDLTTFNIDLPSLKYSSGMFSYCTNLTTFSSDLPSLTDGRGMFYSCTALPSFTSDLPSLTFGDSMFQECINLESFNSNLSSLTEGENMFGYCINLTSFNSDLSSLTNGIDMFAYCKLNAQSVANIIHFIPQRDAKPIHQYEDGNICIGLGIANTDEAKQAFAEECDCADWTELNKEFDDKNWGVQWQFNDEATTYSLRDPRPSTAVYAKLEEVIMPTNKKKYKPYYAYTSQDGSKFYNIRWYHESNTNNEGYDYFESLEEAISTYNVTPKN